MTIAEFAGPGQLDLAGRAALIGQALLSRGLPVIERIFAAGLGTALGGPDRLSPLLLVDVDYFDMKAGEIRRINDIPQVREIVLMALSLTLEEGGDLLGDACVYGLPSPDVQIAPGDDVRRPAMGRVGCGVTWSGGAGFATAGHVVGASGSVVSGSGGLHLGTVRYANYPAGSATAPMADFGVVELPSGLSMTAPFGGTGAAGPNASISIHKGTAVTGNVMGFCSYLYLRKIGGTYGDTYFTTSGLTVGGDSGSAVTIGMTIAGIVVAGTPGYTTYFQDIRYMLASAVPGGGMGGMTV